MLYSKLSKEELEKLKLSLTKDYNSILERGLSLDMSRGKPGNLQLDLSEQMLNVIAKNSDCISENGTDCRNYGIVDGLTEAKKLIGDILGVTPDNVIIGGNSSLNLMFDHLTRCMLFGVPGGKPWCKNKTNKFLCPVPGYDRHFAICQTLGIEMISIPMTPTGPDMDMVEEYIKDPDVRGIWCVPKFSNPDGVVYSDETVRRFASMKPASPDFIIMWDNAYCIHELYDEEIMLLNIIDECEKAGNPDRVYVFSSTSKVSYPGAGISAIAASKRCIEHIISIMKYQTIGYDKMNMLRHVKYFGNVGGIRVYMKKHAEILRPKFEAVLTALEHEFAGLGIAKWSNPKGGYFVSLDLMSGCAKRTVELCRKAGVVLTEAGATFPYGIDPCDSNIRIAPSYPATEDLEVAMSVLCLCAKLAAVEKLLK